ncbi:hypothetical protein TEA_008785 [Camellia sinensis var. sinensis]|uniref:Nuclear pore complex protein n=1 Tax=Camellia sinensis var. sinensis TaxID=542762 RepID=A0A4V3WP82_CAMSN|nr:hypothetical protein TEA_008785 [Camellia sinensis var. sinensis]
MPIPDLILQFERSCRNVSESIRYGSNERQRIVEDKLMRQKARVLLDEAASCVTTTILKLLECMLIESPTTSHLEACQFVVADHTAQLGLRIVQWLEGLASKVLDWDNEVRGSHVGTYLPSSGVWRHTQRALKKGVSKPKTVHHLDFDAPTREHAEQLPDDKKQDESLLEDVWTLLRAGRLEEACDLCRSAGQRIAEQDGGKYETAVYAAQCSNLKRILPICTDWESACWAMAKSWLDVQVDLELARLQPGGMDQFKTYEDAIDRSHGQGDSVSPSTVGPENWPLQVLNQQPRHLPALLQKLHSSDSVHEAITEECKEQHRQIEVYCAFIGLLLYLLSRLSNVAIVLVSAVLNNMSLASLLLLIIDVQMNLMMGDIPHLLDVIWSWISPSEDEENVFRPHGDPQMIRFGAHLVLVLRYLLVEQMKDAFREKIMTVGDLILHITYKDDTVEQFVFIFVLISKILAPASACWAMAKSWLDVQVDLELARLQPGGMDQFKTYEEAIDRSHGQGDNVSPSTVGPENWPLQVLNQQPRHLPALLQKLHSSDSVHEAITQECKEQHRQIEVRASS